MQKSAKKFCKVDKYVYICTQQTIKQMEIQFKYYDVEMIAHVDYVKGDPRTHDHPGYGSEANCYGLWVSDSEQDIWHLFNAEQQQEIEDIIIDQIES